MASVRPWFACNSVKTGKEREGWSSVLFHGWGSTPYGSFLFSRRDSVVPMAFRWLVMGFFKPVEHEWIMHPESIWKIDGSYPSAGSLRL